MRKEVEKACEISVEILKDCINNFKNFKTERDVAKFLRRKAKEKRCKLAFLPLVVSGGNFLEIHHKVNNTKLKGFVILDFGVKYKGYCSDITRTVYVGKPSKKDLELYDLVLRLYKTVLKEIKINKDVRDLDLMVRDGFGKYKKNFKHSLGHGVGKKPHITPRISFNSNKRFKRGQIITIEPGLYFRNKGIRIEDIIYLGEKIKVLSKMSRELEIIS